MTDALDILSKLPPKAFIDNVGADGKRKVYQTDAPIIAVTRGESGFHPIYTARSADELNEADGVTPAQREAMFFGSLFGFHVPGADPERYDAQGKLLRTAS